MLTNKQRLEIYVHTLKQTIHKQTNKETSICKISMKMGCMKRVCAFETPTNPNYLPSFLRNDLTMERLT